MLLSAALAHIAHPAIERADMPDDSFVGPSPSAGLPDQLIAAASSFITGPSRGGS